MRPCTVIIAAAAALLAAERGDGAFAMALSGQAWRAWVRLQAYEADAEQVRLADQGIDALRRAGLLGKG